MKDEEKEFFIETNQWWTAARASIRNRQDLIGQTVIFCDDRKGMDKIPIRKLFDTSKGMLLGIGLDKFFVRTQIFDQPQQEEILCNYVFLPHYQEKEGE